MSKHERNKSSSGGGLLDSWFGRPKSKAKGYTPSNGSGSGSGSGRPVSLESDALADMQDITNEIHRLTSDEVNEKFNDILEDMNIPQDKRLPLLKKTLEEKRSMLIMKGACVFCSMERSSLCVYVRHGQMICCSSLCRHSTSC